MADGWSPLSMLPRDGREVWFTRSLNSVGNIVDLSAPREGEPVILGHLDENEMLVIGDVVDGDRPDDDAGWAPTHWMEPIPDNKDEEQQRTVRGSMSAPLQAEIGAEREQAGQRDAHPSHNPASDPRLQPEQDRANNPGPGGTANLEQPQQHADDPPPPPG